MKSHTFCINTKEETVNYKRKDIIMQGCVVCRFVWPLGGACFLLFKAIREALLIRPLSPRRNAGTEGAFRILYAPFSHRASARGTFVLYGLSPGTFRRVLVDDNSVCRSLKLLGSPLCLLTPRRCM